MNFSEHPVPHGSLTSVNEANCRGVFIVIPGMGIPARFYQPFAEALSEAGYSVSVLELMGNGCSPVRPSRKVDYGYREFLADLKTLVDDSRGQYPEMPIYLAGHSLGGQLALLHASRYPDTVDRVLVVAGGSPHHRLYSGRMRFLLTLAPWIFRLGTLALGYHAGRRYGFGGNEARTVIADWSRLARSNQFHIEGESWDYNRSLAELSLPFDLVGFEGDSLVPRDGAEGMARWCPAADLSFEWLGTSVTGRPMGHFDWVESSHSLLPIFLQRFPAPPPR